MIGLMFYMQKGQDFMDALQWSMNYYRGKLNQEPEVCIVHPGLEIPTDSPLKIKAAPYILERCFWILYEQDKL